MTAGELVSLLRTYPPNATVAIAGVQHDREVAAVSRGLRGRVVLAPGVDLPYTPEQQAQAEQGDRA